MKKDLLIDTNVLLYWFFDSKKLRKHINFFDKKVLFVSSYSLWEIVIKEQIGKLEIPMPIR